MAALVESITTQIFGANIASFLRGASLVDSTVYWSVSTRLAEFLLDALDVSLLIQDYFIPLLESSFSNFSRCSLILPLFSFIISHQSFLISHPLQEESE